MNENKEIRKDDNHFKSVTGAFFYLLFILVLPFIVGGIIIFVQEDTIDFAIIVSIALTVVQFLYPLIIIGLLIAIYRKLKNLEK